MVGLGAARQGISQASPPAIVPLPSLGYLEKSLLLHNLKVQIVLKEEKTLGAQEPTEGCKARDDVVKVTSQGNTTTAMKSAASELAVIRVSSHQGVAECSKEVEILSG